jgi:hypothetical protein
MLRKLKELQEGKVGCRWPRNLDVCSHRDADAVAAKSMMTGSKHGLDVCSGRCRTSPVCTNVLTLGDQPSRYAADIYDLHDLRHNLGPCRKVEG